MWKFQRLLNFLIDNNENNLTNKNRIFILHGCRINFHVEHIHVSFLITRYRYEECFSESYLLFGGIKKKKKKKIVDRLHPTMLQSKYVVQQCFDVHCLSTKF